MTDTPDTSGFYKPGGGDILFAPNAVYGPDGSFTLLRETGAATPPTDGWAWFDSEASARTAYGIPAPETPPSP